MSKITNDGLTRSGTGSFIAYSCTYVETEGVKGLITNYLRFSHVYILQCFARYDKLWSKVAKFISSAFNAPVWKRPRLYFETPFSFEKD